MLKNRKNIVRRYIKVILVSVFGTLTLTMNGQEKIVFGIHADPVISWFSSDVKQVSSAGARPGFNFGISFNRYFTDNYSFSTGISLVNAGGKLKSTEPTVMRFSNFTSVVPAGGTILYRVKYLSIPLGLKFQTNQIGYLTYFADAGLDPKIVVGGKVDIPTLKIEGENAMKELRGANLSYHITGGVEYSAGGTTALVFGLSFENNFFDVTKDNTGQVPDKVAHRLLSFRLGVNF
jgi:hypothetical protein